MNKKKTTYYFLIIAGILICFFSWYYFNSKSCEYCIDYDNEKNPDMCNINITECIFNICAGPNERIKCGDTIKICNKSVKCNCTENDNNSCTKKN